MSSILLRPVAGLKKYSATCVLFVSFHFALCHWPSSRTFTSSGRAGQAGHRQHVTEPEPRLGSCGAELESTEPGQLGTPGVIISSWYPGLRVIISSWYPGLSVITNNQCSLQAGLGRGHWLMASVSLAWPCEYLQILHCPGSQPSTWRTCVTYQHNCSSTVLVTNAIRRSYWWAQLFNESPAWGVYSGSESQTQISVTHSKPQSRASQTTLLLSSSVFISGHQARHDTSTTTH